MSINSQDYQTKRGEAKVIFAPRSLILNDQCKAAGIALTRRLHGSPSSIVASSNHKLRLHRLIQKITGNGEDLPSFVSKTEINFLHFNVLHPNEKQPITFLSAVEDPKTLADIG
jgi:hypothetical protein